MELTLLVLGSIIDGGVFDLMQNMAAVPAGAGAILIVWIIAGIGMIFLALSFKNLSMKRQDLDAGIYSYAEEGFGKYIGFNSEWLYNNIYEFCRLLSSNLLIRDIMFVTLLLLGVMKQSKVASLSQPAMVALLTHVIGKIGVIIVKLGLIISVASAWPRTMFVNQVLYERVKNGILPSFFAKENKYHVSVNLLIITTFL